mmetsp:Transcript_59056/g.103344  ORF Transcript_59056/g.103344 Transcript_59056/m.103344 type:complete len:562 (+) Transcript_59056:88-1773(+)
MAKFDEEYNGISRTECIRGMNMGPADSRASYISQIGDLGAVVMSTLGLLDEVAKMVKDASPKVQEQALIAIGKMGGDAKNYTTEVTACVLGSTFSAVQIAACNTLGVIRETPQFSKGQVRQLIVSPNVDLSLAAIACLGKLNATDAIGDLIKLLSNEVPAVAAAAAKALGDIGDADQVVPEMANLLESQEYLMRRAALTVVKSSGKAATKYSATVVKLLGDSDPVVRQLAVDIYSMLGDDAKPLLDKTVKILSGQEGAAKCAAAMALGSMGAESCAPKLAELLTDTFEELASQDLWLKCTIKRPPVAMRRTCCAGAMALSMLGEKGAAYAKDVSKLLRDDNWEVRVGALEALGGMGKAGAAFEPVVVEMFSDSEVAVVCAALIACGKMGEAVGGSSKEVVEKVAKKLTVQQAFIRTAAAKALCYMGLEVQGQHEALIKAFDDRCPRVKVNAMEAVARSGPIGTLLAPRIGVMFRDENRLVRAGAVSVMPIMGERGANLLDEMTFLLEDPEAEVRAACVTAIGAFGGQSSYLYEAVESMKQDSAESVRSAAAVAAVSIAEAS